MKPVTITAASMTALVLAACTANTVEETTETVTAEVEQGLCLSAGPQTPRDITSVSGSNPVMFPMAPSYENMNLCNIHTHTNAEHKGPGFSIFVGATDDGGYACNMTADLTAAELAPAPGAYKGVKPGDTIEVHWVHTTCDAEPGEGLGACVPEGCTDPVLRVEAQVFLVVNDADALDFTEMAYGAGYRVDGRPQAKMIPSDTGTPIEFLGSTTGPSYTQSTCSPAQVTWNVRPNCAKVDINSLHRWAEGNVFNETQSHGVRQLVTAEPLLSPIR